MFMDGLEIYKSGIKMCNNDKYIIDFLHIIPNNKNI